jgi:hypothetical protein
MVQDSCHATVERKNDANRTAMLGVGQIAARTAAIILSVEMGKIREINDAIRWKLDCTILRHVTPLLLGFLPPLLAMQPNAARA